MVLSNIPPEATEKQAQQPQPQANNQEFPIPSCSSWFSFDKIDDIERRALPEFFPDEPTKFKSPEIYREYRDFMIGTFRMRSKEYLTVTTCRRYLTGDITSIMRIHAFLEQWGLINYQVLEGPNSGTFTAPTSKASDALLAGSTTHVNQDSVSLDAFLKSESSISIICKSCSGECSSIQNGTSYYHCPAGKFNLCVACYTGGKYSSDLASTDFVKIDPSSFQSATAGAEWSEEEVLKLMEAIEKYSDSGVNMAANNVWDAIAENVGRPREACLLQFLKFPTSEFLESSQAPSDSSFSSAISPSSFLNFPFSQSENPVLSVLAFLANHVHPRVAAVASQAALAEISKVENEIAGNQAHMQQIAATSLACASAHAKNLADAESNRINYWRDLLIETQMKKLQLKIESLDELERSVEEERKEIEKQRLQIFMERFNLRKMLLQAEQRISNASIN
jgi:SWI/SNF related-matrix-associated actin-dependent regulator of chromatin subfamily C